MISRISIPLLLVIVLSDIYIYKMYVRERAGAALRALWWLPGAVMVVYTVALAVQRDFAPGDNAVLNVYLFLMGLTVVPKMLFTLFDLAGRWLRRIVHGRRNYGAYVGAAAALVTVYILVYGSTAGFRGLDIRYEDYYSAALPEAFDGFRIVHFSDAHVGTYGKSGACLLERAVDSINALKGDIIVFAGDLQNMRAEEIAPYTETLASLHADGGVYSVLGNHDYAYYVDASAEEKAAMARATADTERSMGWTLLNNSHVTLRRGADSIVIAGMENDGEATYYTRKGDIRKALDGVTDSAFTVMIEHDPRSWRTNILPHSAAALTLSGHTHAMQFVVFGWSPVALMYREWGGMYYEGSRAINVSTGLGGFIPFRFGVPGEIVVITLRRGEGVTGGRHTRKQ